MEGYFLHIADKLQTVRTQSKSEGQKSGTIAELKSLELWRAVLAEGLSTTLFVMIGCMSVMDIDQIDQVDKNAKFIRIAFTFGLMIAVCIQMIGHVSGGHINPAVTIAMMVTCNISVIRGLLFCLAQCAGGVIGAFLLKGFTPKRLHDNLAVTGLNDDLNTGQGVACEILFTFILVLSIFGCTDSNRPFFGSPALGIGLTVTVIHLAAIPFTGASMNPARSLGSAVVSCAYDDHWVYWAGPICGGIAAGLVYKYILNPYRGYLSYEEATSQLFADNKEMIAIPKSYFVDGKLDTKTSIAMQHA